MPRLLLCLLVLALGGASSFLAACGDRNGLLPASKADAMIQDLNSVSDAIGSGDCTAAQKAVSRAKSVLHSATASRRTLTDRLRLELDHLAGIASTQCQPTTTTTTPTTTSTTATTPSTQTTETTTTTRTRPRTQTTDTSSNSTSTTSDTTTTPTDTSQTSGGAVPGGGDGSGKGKGKGDGGGSGGG